MTVQRHSVSSHDDVSSGLSLEPLSRSQLCCPFSNWRVGSILCDNGVQFLNLMSFGCPKKKHSRSRTVPLNVRSSCLHWYYRT